MSPPAPSTADPSNTAGPSSTARGPAARGGPAGSRGGTRFPRPTLPGSLGRELAILAGALAFGVLLVPPLLALILPHELGPYAGGGLGALEESFFRGLAGGTFGFWAVAVIPYLVTLVVRALIALVRLAPAAD